jgi:hypothetical protein
LLSEGWEKEKNIEFYDDALFVEPETHIQPILKGLIERICNFIHPRCLSVRYLAPETHCS